MANNIKVLKYRILYVAILLLTTVFVYSQSESVNSNYELKLEKYLNPEIDTTTTKEVVLFLATPSFDKPECSIRIIEIGNQTFIEVRMLKKNLWDELHEISIKNKKILSLETDCFSAPISNSFRDKILSVFSKVIVLHKSTIKPKVVKKYFGYYKGKRFTYEEFEGNDFFDGTSFEFRIIDVGNKSSTKISCPLDSTDFRSQVANTNLQIINDLKNGTFDESKYEIYR